MTAKPFHVLLCAATLGSSAALGCSSSGEDTIPGDAPETGAAVDAAPSRIDANLPPRDGGTTDPAPRDATIPDAEIGDATVPDTSVRDAGRDTGTLDAGSRACTSASDIEERSCGICGTQSRICRALADGGLDWAAWSFCNGQRAEGCEPGTEPDGGVPCGTRCGRQRAVCQANCAWAYGSCVPAPNAECDRGLSIWEQSDAGCTDPALGKRRTCLDNCGWSPWTECEPQFVERDGGVSAAADLVITSDAVRSVVRSFAGAPTISRFPAPLTGYGLCPIADNFTVQTPYVFATVANATTATRKIALWTSGASLDGGAGVNIDTISAVYPLATVPSTEAERRACVGGPNDACPGGTPEGCVNPSSGHVGPNAVSIPSGAVYTFVVHAAFAGSTGVVRLNAKAIE